MDYINIYISVKKKMMQRKFSLPLLRARDAVAASREFGRSLKYWIYFIHTYIYYIVEKDIPRRIILMHSLEHTRSIKTFINC